MLAAALFSFSLLALWCNPGQAWRILEVGVFGFETAHIISGSGLLLPGVDRPLWSEPLS